jgi:hypothetical protein
MIRTTLGVGWMLLVAHALQAQGRPESWRVRLDSGRQPDTTFGYTTMSPGWHITSNGNAGILYDPGWRSPESYRLELSVFVFPSSAAEEGLGLFLAGQKLEAPDQSYWYFLIRPDGRYIVKHRAGAETPEITQWTPSAAIAKPGEKPAKNLLTAEVGPEQVTFSINGQSVFSRPRKDLGSAAGQAGIRVNHGVNIHVTAVELKPATP